VRIGPFRFQPGLYPVIAFALTLPLLLSLAWWQKQRADEKEHRQLRMEQGQRMSGSENLNQTPVDRLIPYRHVTATGHFDSEHYWLQDNQLLHGAPGYHVYSLFLLDGGKRRGVLVNRGWIPVGDDRRMLPDVSITTPIDEVSGYLGRPASVGMTLGDSSAEYQRLTAVVPDLDLDRISKVTGVSLLPWVVYLDASNPLAFRSVWHAPRRMGPEKHRGYAIQWLAMAIALSVIFIAVNTKRIDE